MIVVRTRLWRSAGAAAALSLAACGGEGGEAGRHGEAGEAGEGGDVVAPPPAAAPAAAAGGEQGEAGAATAFAGLTGDQLTALRLQHLKGFVLAAETLAAAGKPAEAAVLVQQGLLEAHAPAADQFGALDVSAVAAAGDASVSDAAQEQQRIEAALAAIDAAGRGLNVDHAILAARMVDIATGLYQGVVHEDYVDAVEYAHSHGAALSAADALAKGARELRRRDGRAFRDAQSEIARFAALWPAAEPPATPASYRDVLAQSSRVRLALSPYL